MDLRRAPLSRNFEDHTNYLTMPAFAGLDPMFRDMLLEAYFSPANKLLNEKHRNKSPNMNAQYEVLFRNAARKYGKITDQSSFDDFRR